MIVYFQVNDNFNLTRECTIIFVKELSVIFILIFDKYLVRAISQYVIFTRWVAQLYTNPS